MNLGYIGSLIIKLEATGAGDVEKSIDKASKSLDKMGTTAKKSTIPSLFSLNNLMKLTVAGGFASMILESPLITSYLGEFGDALGYIGDIIGTIFEPFINIAIDALWELADWFDKQVPMLSAAFAGLLPAFRVFIDFLVAVGKVALVALVELLGKVIVFITDLFTAIYNKDWMGAWNVVANAARSVWNWLVSGITTILLDPLSEKITGHKWTGVWDFLGGALNKMWTDYIKPLLPTWLTDFLTWMKNFFEGDGATKLRMIGEVIVKAMDWLAMAKLAVEIFIKGLQDELSRNANKLLFGETPIKLQTSFVGGVKGSGQTGIDYVPSTGPYLLHQGEKVIPASNNSSSNIYNTFNISGSNARDIADEVMRIISVQNRRLA